MKKSVKLKGFVITLILFFSGISAHADAIYSASSEQVIAKDVSISTDTLNFTPYTSTSLSFSYGGSGSSGGTLTVTYTNDAGATWNPLTTLTTTTTSYKTTTVDLSAVTGTKVVVKFSVTVKPIKVKLISITGNSTTGIKESKLVDNIKVSEGSISFSGLPDATISIYCASGELVVEKQISGNSSVSLPSGIYIVKITSTGFSGVKKVFVK